MRLSKLHSCKHKNVDVENNDCEEFVVAKRQTCSIIDLTFLPCLHCCSNMVTAIDLFFFLMSSVCAVGDVYITAIVVYSVYNKFVLPSAMLACN